MAIIDRLRPTEGRLWFATGTTEERLTFSLEGSDAAGWLQPDDIIQVNDELMLVLNAAQEKTGSLLQLVRVERGYAGSVAVPHAAWARTNLISVKMPPRRHRLLEPEEVRRRFHYHAPDAATRDVHDRLRQETIGFVYRLDELLGDSGPSDELDLALRRFEEATFWLHAHVARNMHHG